MLDGQSLLDTDSSSGEPIAAAYQLKAPDGHRIKWLLDHEAEILKLIELGKKLFPPAADMREVARKLEGEKHVYEYIGGKVIHVTTRPVSDEAQAAITKAFREGEAMRPSIKRILFDLLPLAGVILAGVLIGIYFLTRN